MTSSESARRFRSKTLRLAGPFVVALAVAACSGGSKSPTVPSVDAGPATTTAQSGASSASATTPLAKAQAYSECMRNHGVSNFPDPVATPSGGYGFRTQGIDPKSSAFQSGSQTCNALVPGGWDSGKPLTPVQQQRWLDWAKCIRAHGVPGFSDPTFSGEEVHVSQGDRTSPQMQPAMDACKSQMPSTGGLGG